MRLATLPCLALLLAPLPASALSMSDPLTAWAAGSAMDRLQLAGRFGKSFVALDQSFTAEYFVRCIDDISIYGGAKSARIEDAMRECVAARMKLTGQPDE